MALFSLNHKYIGKKTHPRRVASAHLRYVLRASACTEVIAANIPKPKIGTRGGKAKAWLEKHEDNARKNGRVIDKLMLALPIELDVEQRVELIKEFVADITGGEETYWLAALHDQESPNPHAHLIFVDKGVHTGKRVIEFSERDSTRRLRERWSAVTNDYYARNGIDAKIDHRSLKMQREETLLRAEWALYEAERAACLKAAEKLNRKPAGHDGPELQAYEAKGETSDKLERLRNLRADLSKDDPQNSEQEPPTPTRSHIKKLLNALPQSNTRTHRTDAEIQINRRWDEGLGQDGEHSGMVAVLATLHPNAAMPELQDMASRLKAGLKSDPDHPLGPYQSQIETLGRMIKNGNWRKLGALVKLVPAMVREPEVLDYVPPAPEPEFHEAPNDDARDDDQEPVATFDESTTTETSASSSENNKDGQPQTQDDSRTPEPHIEEEIRLARDAAQRNKQEKETEAEEQRAASEIRKARRIEEAEKAMKRAQQKLEREITASRKRVLRGRTTLNWAKGAFSNAREGRDAFTPYPQSSLRMATDTFLSAAKWLTSVWEAYRTGENSDANFAEEERAYIEASATLTEMHIVVPKPQSMTGEDLVDEKERLQNLHAFPDKELITPVMARVKKRLSQVVSYLTGTDEGIAKIEEINAKKRAEEADRQQKENHERYLREQRQLRHQKERHKSITADVMSVLRRSEDDPEIRNIVAAYGFNNDLASDEIANDPFWRGLAPGTRNYAWFDLQERAKELDAARKEKADRIELRKLAPTISRIMARLRTENDPELNRLTKSLGIHQFTDPQSIRENLDWVLPVRNDGQNRPLWKAAADRIDQLDRIAERLKQREQGLKTRQEIQSKRPASDPEDDPSP